MARATCRCGQVLKLPDQGAERVICPKCRSKVRVRVKAPPADGFLRFFCPCGRRLKVSAAQPPSHGRCPDCGRVVPVPRSAGPGGKPSGHPEANTVDLGPGEVAALEQWTRRFQRKAGDSSEITTPQILTKPIGQAGSTRAEAGLRVCPKCRLPVHLGADACRACGTPVPRR
jgi:hypothetical protein